MLIYQNNNPCDAQLSARLKDHFYWFFTSLPGHTMLMMLDMIRSIYE